MDARGSLLCFNCLSPTAVLNQTDHALVPFAWPVLETTSALHSSQLPMQAGQQLLHIPAPPPRDSAVNLSPDGSAAREHHARRLGVPAPRDVPNPAPNGTNGNTGSGHNQATPAQHAQVTATIPVAGPVHTQATTMHHPHTAAQHTAQGNISTVQSPATAVRTRPRGRLSRRRFWPTSACLPCFK